MTKVGAKTATVPAPRFEVALACDAGTTNGGMYGLTDLFSYASEFAMRRQDHGEQMPVRITHWRADDDGAAIRCTYDTCPGVSHAPSVVIIPNNHRGIAEPERDSPYVDWLRLKHAEGVVLAAVCGGVFILAKTGLLAGRQATTHWAFSDQFSAQFPDVLMESDQMVIDYGDVLTAGGALAWVDLGLRLTERFLGPAVMLDTARYMNHDPPGREQRFYSGFEPRTKHGDGAILKAQNWLSTQRERAVTVAELAHHVGLEPRTFLRRFVHATGMKPSEYQQRVRMTRARELLEFSRASVDEIAATVGYGDARGFRRVFFKIVGLTPSDYRRRFSPVGQKAIDVTTSVP
jgi:transcriptional regulator GlxA family with amidase domain